MLSALPVALAATGALFAAVFVARLAWRAAAAVPAAADPRPLAAGALFVLSAVSVGYGISAAAGGPPSIPDIRIQNSDSKDVLDAKMKAHQAMVAQYRDDVERYERAAHPDRPPSAPFITGGLAGVLVAVVAAGCYFKDKYG